MIFERKRGSRRNQTTDRRTNSECTAALLAPHHFDLDTLVTIETGHTMGIKFSPGDEYYEEPYFYVSMYPRPDFMTLPRLPSIGHWHSKDFSAAIAPARQIFEANEQEADVRAFLCAATKAASPGLSHPSAGSPKADVAELLAFLVLPLARWSMELILPTDARKI